jgi:hypothetical protein
MIVAACVKCGAIKPGAFSTCEVCAIRPETEIDLAYSLALTEHHFQVDAVRKISVPFLAGKRALCCGR